MIKKIIQVLLHVFIISFYYIINNYLLPLIISRFPRFSIDPRTPTLNPKGLAPAPAHCGLISENPGIRIIQK
jgi:hypothetical protein